MLYISYGTDGPGCCGNLLKYDLVHDSVVWQKELTSAVDSHAISPDGMRIYMPTGELASGSVWNVLVAITAIVIGIIDSPGGNGPHNTVVTPKGTLVYMGIRYYNFLEVADAATYTIVKSVGPLKDGVRPFTVNSAETLVFTTASGFLGFEVSSLITGQVLYTVPVNGFSVPMDFKPSAPSHGISMSPDEKEIYLIDAANSYVHVFDVTGLPAAAPVQVADIQVATISGKEQGCAYDCSRDGWLLHSRDGRFVYVGDSGSVIDTSTRAQVANLTPLSNTRKMIEVDFLNGIPVWAATSRSGIGYGPSAVTTTTT
jgi:DNA-binding beta-propeller fold protein YncE